MCMTKKSIAYYVIDMDPIRMHGNDVNIFVTVMKLRGTIM
jgi:hypothetical protein